MSEFTQGVSSDGAAILRDGSPLTIEQVITALYRAEAVAKNGHKKLDAFNEINALCWNAKGSGKTEIPVNQVLAILENYCD